MPYPTLPYVWSLDGVLFNTGDGAFITHADGWAGNPAPRTSRQPRVGAAGDWAGSTYGGPRTIEIAGKWFASGQAARFAAVDVLTELFTAGLPEADYAVSRTEGTRARQTAARLDDELVPRVHPSGMITFETQLYCADARWWGLAPTVWPVTPLPSDAPGGVLWNGTLGTSGGGVEWNGSSGTSGDGVLWGLSGTGGDGSVTVYNTGNAAYGVTVTFQATGGTGLLRPFVTIPATGETIQYRGTIPVGQSLTVDTETGIVTLAGARIPSALIRDDFFKIPKRGSRRLLFGSSGPGDQGYMSGFNYAGYQGG